MEIESTHLEHHLNEQLAKNDEFDRFFWHRVRWQATKVAFPSDKNFKLLDIGAGTGQVGRYLKLEYPTVEYNFIEPLESLEKNLCRVHGDRHNFASKQNYDGIQIVTCLDVIEHIENDREFVNDIIDKMPPQSRLLLTVPANMSLWSKWDELMGHYRRYSKKSLLDIIPLEKVKTNRCHYLFPEMFFAGLLRKGSAKKDNQKNSEFPKLPRSINGLFYLLSNSTRLLGAINPIGSSLLIDLTKK